MKFIPWIDKLWLAFNEDETYEECSHELPAIFKLDNNKFTGNNAKFLVTVAKQYD